MGIRRNFKPTNFVANGDFSKGTTEWDASSSNISSASNTLFITGSGVAIGPGAYNITATTVKSNGNKYYVRVKLRVTNAVCTGLTLIVNGSTGGTVQSYGSFLSPLENTWYIKSAVITQPANWTGLFKISAYHSYADAATANGKVMEVQQVLAIDLTALFGAGNEPTQAWCDLNIPNWFDGTLSGGKRIGGVR